MMANASRCGPCSAPYLPVGQVVLGTTSVCNTELVDKFTFHQPGQKTAVILCHLWVNLQWQSGNFLAKRHVLLTRVFEAAPYHLCGVGLGVASRIAKVHCIGIGRIVPAGRIVPETQRSREISESLTCMWFISYLPMAYIQVG